MRVLHVMEAVGGGTMRHLEDLVRGTTGDHHVVCPRARHTDLSDPDPVARLQGAGAAVHPLEMSRRALDPCNLSALPAIRAIIRAVVPDVVHAHASVAGALVRLVAPPGVPVIWTPHAVQEGRAALFVERALRKRADVVVALSASEAQRAVSVRIATEHQVRLIPNGIQPTRQGATRSGLAGLRQELGLPHDARVVGFIGRLSAQKGPADFVNVAARVLEMTPEAHVLLVGSGPLEAETLRAAARLLPPERFRHVTADTDGARLLPAMDVLVMPSHYEGGPYLPLEAMAAGIPVVATNCTGLRDYVVEGLSGLTASVGDCDGLAAATRRLLVDRDMRQQVVASASVFLRQNHDIGQMLRAYDELYQVASIPAASRGNKGQLPGASSAH
jgi:glycosyltransferase involved in cell wall biosynthesis